MIGDIMAVSRLRMGSDGHGISTLVAFFDCPLHCKYCINNHCHEQEYTSVDTPRASYTPEELVEVLKKDEIYYLMTNGGIVFGGGEPLLQSNFIHEVCRISDKRWSRRLETSLNVPWRCVEPVLDDFDEWIIDIKNIMPTTYYKYTGFSNRRVIDNLYKLKEIVPLERLHIRVPLIEGYNTEEDVSFSADWIRSEIGVKPEIFKYYVLPHTTHEISEEMNEDDLDESDEDDVDETGCE